MNSTEQYRREVVVDGEVITVSSGIRKCLSCLIAAQLEILDTAGAEQFTALNELYITVSGD